MVRLLPLLLALVAPTLAANLPDLGHGLSYLRVRDLDNELPNSASLPAAVVIDFRSSQGGDPAVLAQVRELVSESAKGRLRLILVDRQTPAAVLTALASSGRAILTLAATDASVRSDIPVATPPAVDREAVRLIDSGRAAASLLASPVEKQRYDEAAMVRDHTKGIPPPDAPPDPAPEAPAKTGPDTAPKPPPPFDAVLQRAVQIHRSLVALQKLN